MCSYVAGAAVDFKGERMAVLLTAAFAGQTEITKVLIDMKCDVNVQTKSVTCDLVFLKIYLNCLYVNISFHWEPEH